MKYKSLFLAIPLLCFVACSSNDDVEEPENNLKRPIRVTVSEAPLTDTLTAHAHKSPITVKSTLKQFCLNYDFEDEFSDPLLFTNPIEVAGEWIWESQSQGNWPQSAGDNDMVPFYAYAGIDTEYDVAEKDDDGSVYLDFTVDEFSGDTKDLLVAKTEASYSQDGTVHFLFHHACAALQFTICKTEKLENLEVKVKEIKIHQLKNNAKYYFDKQNPWVLTDNSFSNYTIKAYTSGQSGGAITVEQETAQNPAAFVGDGQTDYLFAIPQTITPWNGTGSLQNSYVEIVCSITNGNRQFAQNPDGNGYGSVYIPFTVSELKQNFVHHVKIVMGTALKKSDGTSIFQ